MGSLASPHLCCRCGTLGLGGVQEAAERPPLSPPCEADPPAPSVNVNMQGPADPVLRRALNLFATALAMLDFSCTW